MKNAPPDKIRLSVDNKKRPLRERASTIYDNSTFRLVGIGFRGLSGTITIRRTIPVTSVAVGTRGHIHSVDNQIGCREMPGRNHFVEQIERLLRRITGSYNKKHHVGHPPYQYRIRNHTYRCRIDEDIVVPAAQLTEQFFEPMPVKQLIRIGRYRARRQQIEKMCIRDRSMVSSRRCKSACNDNNSSTVET